MDKIVHYIFECVYLHTADRSLMFSKACEYGIRAAIHIAHQSHKGQRVGLKSVAKAIDSPTAFTSKILQALVKKEIISSIKGPSGGYEIPQDSRAQLTLASIVEAIDGDDVYRGCGLGLKACNASKPCPVHDQFKEVRDLLADMLKKTTIQELTNGLQLGHSYLRR